MSESPQDVAARDDAHLRSLGIKPELRRSLGFLSNFAIAFSFISVSTGTFTATSARPGVGRPGVLLVVADRHPRPVRSSRSYFAELASHFPVAGSIYQWSKRLSNRTLGWFTGWFYFWAAGRHRHRRSRHRAPTCFVASSAVGHCPFPPADPTGLTTMFTVHLLLTLIIDDAHQRLRCPPPVDHQQYRRGDRDPRDARLRVDPAVLLPNNQSPRSCSPRPAPRPRDWRRTCRPSARMFMSPVRRLRLRYRRDLRRGDARREPPGATRHPVGHLAVGHRRGDLPAGHHPGDRRTWTAGIHPDRITSSRRCDQVRVRRAPSGAVPVRILMAVFVCTLAIQGATTRLMFSMGRDRRMPLGSVWGKVNTTFRTPANAAVAVGVLAAIPFLVSDSPGLSGRRRHWPDLPELLPVQPRRARRSSARLAAQGRLVQPQVAGARSSTSWPSSGAG